jgi:hypothetical protein
MSQRKHWFLGFQHLNTESCLKFGYETNHIDQSLALAGGKTHGCQLIGVSERFASRTSSLVGLAQTRDRGIDN